MAAILSRPQCVKIEMFYWSNVTPLPYCAYADDENIARASIH